MVILIILDQYGVIIVIFPIKGSSQAGVEMIIKTYPTKSGSLEIYFS